MAAVDPAIVKFLEHYHSGDIGKFMLRRSPNGSVAVATERPIKAREMNPVYVELLQRVVAEYGALRLNIICTMDGNVDRIEVYKLIESGG